MGAGASAAPQLEQVEEGPKSVAASAASLLDDVDMTALSDEERQHLANIVDLLRQPGWKRGNKRSDVAVRFRYEEENGLYYVCSSTDVRGGAAESMFNDFNSGQAQQRYNDVCSEEIILHTLERDAPLGHERLARGIYKMPPPLQNRDFIWHEWCALLPAADGGQLYVSVAMSPPEDEAEVHHDPDLVRGNLHLAATLARQSPDAAVTNAASVILGDIRGNMPKALQNMVAGNASSYLANFRNAHQSPEAQ